MEEVKNHKRNRQTDNCVHFHEDENAVHPGDCQAEQDNDEQFSAKKPREDPVENEDSTTMQSSKSNEDDYDDDDYDDYDDPEDHANLSDNEDFLEDFEDDVSVTSASTTVSTGKILFVFP